MANYLYNGVEFPALPNYDASYPYAAICQASNTTWLILSKIKLVYSGDAARNPSDSGIVIYRYYIGANSGEWVDSGTTALASNGGYANPVWANYDILNADGTLYLAASDPIPVGTAFPSDFDPRSWEIGRLVGQAVRRLRGKAKEYTHYSYNGVVLPNINTVWTDKEKYQYAFVNTGYGFVTFSDGLLEYDPDYVWNGEATPMFILRTPSGENVSYIRYKATETGWEEWDREDAVHGYILHSIFDPWANFDVVNVDDGSIYLAASEPVPV